jgi:hypothetical protein
MVLVDNTSIRRRGMVGMAAAIFTVLVAASSGQGQSGLNITGHGFLLGDGAFTTIDHPDAASATLASGIDNRGRIVGSYVDAGGTIQGFPRNENGVFSTIDVPGALGTDAFGISGTAPADINNRGINNPGQIVGAVYSTGATD